MNEDEFARKIAGHLHWGASHLEGAPPAPEAPIPKLVDIRDGMAVYDERQARKRPDWTYAE